ncbi:MAG: LysR family transcriptional regulator [Pseudomonadales bacterium]
MERRSMRDSAGNRNVASCQASAPAIENSTSEVGMRGMDWDAYRIFCVVAEVGTVRVAANQLATSPSTVTRRLDELERRLGVQLLERNAAGAVLTPAGERLAERLRPLQAELQEIGSNPAGAEGDVSGTVSLALPDYLVPWLSSRLPALFQRHPGLDLHLPAQTRQQPADIRISGQSMPDPQWIARMLGRFETGLYTRSGTAARVSPASPEVKLPWLTLNDPDLLLEDEWRTRYPALAGLAERTVVTSASRQLTLLVELDGVGELPRVLGDAAPALERIAQSSTVLSGPVWLLVRQDLHRVRRLRVVYDWLFEEFTSAAAELRLRLDGV